MTLIYFSCYKNDTMIFWKSPYSGHVGAFLSKQA